MTYEEIASTRITGISLPWLGVSWNPPKRDKEVAKKLVTYLEDRRVLYNPNELENPEHCQQSVLQIREFITNLLLDVKGDTDLGVTLRMIRAACRKFLDTIEHYKDSIGGVYRSQMGMGDAFIFDTGIGELRASIGLQLAKLFVMYKLNCEGELLQILPPSID